MFSRIVLIAVLGVFLAGCGASALAQVPTATTEPPATDTNGTVQVCADALNVRLSRMGEVVTTLERGQSLTVSPAVDGWSQIVAGQYAGLWVNASYLCEVQP